jgi:O-antigen/teichoic acid export membrane protein
MRDRPHLGSSSESVEIDVHDATPEDAASYAQVPVGALIRRALAHASTYTVGGLSVRAAELILLPLYWALLPPSQYGVLALAAIVSEFLRAVFGFGLPEAIARFWYDWPAAERPRRLGAIWTGAWLGSALLAGALLLAGPGLLGALIVQVPFSPYLELAILGALASSMVQVPLMVLRIMERPRLYVAGSAAVTLLGAGLAIALVAGAGRGVRGVLEAQVIAPGVVALGYAVYMRRWVRPSLDRTLLAPLLGFSLPLVPSKVLEATATVVDRVVLEKHLSLAALGVYHAARQVGRGVELFGFSVLTAWIPFQMRVLAERIDGRGVIARAAPWFLLAILVASVGMAVLAPPAIRLLGLEGYDGVPPLVPIAVLSGAILSFAHVLIQGYIIARQTRWAWLRSGTRLVAAVVALAVLVPPFGVDGAFVALAIAALVQGGVGYALAQRFFPIAFPWRPIAGMGAAALLAAAAARPLGSLPPAAGLALGALVVGGSALAMARIARGVAPLTGGAHAAD